MCRLLTARNTAMTAVAISGDFSGCSFILRILLLLSGFGDDTRFGLPNASRYLFQPVPVHSRSSRSSRGSAYSAPSSSPRSLGFSCSSMSMQPHGHSGESSGSSVNDFPQSKHTKGIRACLRLIGAPRFPAHPRRHRHRS